MRVAMTMAALICIGIGVVPGVLYGILPHAMDYAPYTTPHVVNQLQLLLLAAMAFTVLIRTGLYPPEIRSVNLDADVMYRRLLPSAWHALTDSVARVGATVGGPLRRRADRAFAAAAGPLRADGWLAIPWSTHLMVWLAGLLFGVVLCCAAVISAVADPAGCGRNRRWSAR